ncbi:uncharacterized protein LOC120663922 [Panicum virgatum]|uniref:Uncharacterized protein n=1 Tax=Panicum virgatum TaxID=38727 RepID=A0A8T0UME8_PANVG|nr:uncharacterized protein LOC120663922 [Panicum virgatum]KAG2622266.1 hypothetical protein PVAP13_3NG274100 [Panicum virgatum]
MKRSGSGAGSCLGLVVMAVVSTGIILISYHLHRRLEADMKVKIGEGANLQDRRRRRPRGAKKVKKVRFADDVVEPSSNNEEYRRRVWSSSTTTITSAVGAPGGGVDAETLSLSLGPPPRKGDALLALPAPTHAMRRRTRRLPEPDACRQRA